MALFPRTLPHHRPCHREPCSISGICRILSHSLCLCTPCCFAWNVLLVFGEGTSLPLPVQPSSPPLCLPPVTTVITEVVYVESHLIRTALDAERSRAPRSCSPRIHTSNPVWLLSVLTQVAVEVKPGDLLVCRAGGQMTFRTVGTEHPTLSFKCTLLDNQ